MFTARNKGRLALGAVVVGAALALSGCATGDPLDSGSSSGASETIVVGSQAYYSNEIIAEIYSQALENAGFTVERKFQIGQRDAYLPSLESGEVDLFPEYTGNLLQFYSPDTTATTSDDVYAELQTALPATLTVLDQALLATYGVTVGFTATGDTTVEDLLAGTVNIANVYSADPRIQTDNLVTLADPEGLFLASNVVPLVNKDVADHIADVINAVQAKLTAEGLVALNVQSTVDQKSSAEIATQWLKDNGLI